MFLSRRRPCLLWPWRRAEPALLPPFGLGPLLALVPGRQGEPRRHVPPGPGLLRLGPEVKVLRADHVVRLVAPAGGPAPPGRPRHGLLPQPGPPGVPLGELVEADAEGDVLVGVVVAEGHAAVAAAVGEAERLRGILRVAAAAAGGGGRGEHATALPGVTGASTTGPGQEFYIFAQKTLFSEALFTSFSSSPQQSLYFSFLFGDISRNLPPDVVSGRLELHLLGDIPGGHLALVGAQVAQHLKEEKEGFNNGFNSH